MAEQATIEVSGHCVMCSWPRDRKGYVFHPGPCPRVLPQALIDTNADRNGQSWTVEEHITRPVEVGELVLLIDYGDGPESPFLTFGRVVGQKGTIVYFDHVGRRGVSSRSETWLYVVED